jgi:hypothetical protein
MISQIAAPKTAAERTQATYVPSRKRAVTEAGFSSNLDRQLRAGVGKFTFSASPIGLSPIYLDWLLYLRTSAAEQLQLIWNEGG